MRAGETKLRGRASEMIPPLLEGNQDKCFSTDRPSVRSSVDRLGESDGHVVLTSHGTVTGRTVRRLAGHHRIQPNLVGKIKSRVQDPALSHAEHLKVLPAPVPIRLAGKTDTEALAEEQDRAAQRCARPNGGHLTRCGARTPDVCARLLSSYAQ